MQYTGLTTAQVENARKQGENRLKESGKSSVAGLFFSQFKDLMILILAAATIVSALMGETAEAVTIIAIVLLNAVMGFLQEYKTEKTLAALQSLAAPAASVIRDGKIQSIPAVQVVCGDIVLLRMGDRVPADGVLLEAESLSLDESLLTGESSAVEKSVGEKVCMGTMAATGKGTMRVEAVGMQTEMGRIAAMMQDTKSEKTPLQNRLQQLGKTVAIGCLIICIGVSLIGWLRGEALLATLLSGISLAVAAIPEGMPAIVTVVLALSVGRILKKGAIIRRLPAVETLGCAGVICSDKTGTITQNKMKLCQVYYNDSLRETTDEIMKEKTALHRSNTLQRLFRCMVLCSEAQLQQCGNEITVQGSATETALLTGAIGLGGPADRLFAAYQRIREDPFDSNKKRMAVTVKSSKGERLFLCKGAPDILLKICDRVAFEGGDRLLSAAEGKRIRYAMRTMAEKGYRILAFAENTDADAGERGMIFLGLAALQDPPKPQVKAAVRRCRRAGMKPVMITGDYPQTARAIAEQVGIWKNGDKVVTGEELAAMTDELLKKQCMEVSVFARVTPQDKLRIVKAYQSCGQVVAMTGDGVIKKYATKSGSACCQTDPLLLCIYWGEKHRVFSA